MLPVILSLAHAPTHEDSPALTPHALGEDLLCTRLDELPQVESLVPRWTPLLRSATEEACQGACTSSAGCLEYSHNNLTEHCELWNDNTSALPGIGPVAYQCAETALQAVQLSAQRGPRRRRRNGKSSGAVPDSVKASLTKGDKIFFLGPGKTGTETLNAIFSTLGMATCHDICNGNGWSRTRNANSPVFKNQQVFMDNGEFADLAWLDNNFPGARFVLNTRPLKDWIVSKYDHVRSNRMNAGCKPEGTPKDCPVGMSDTGIKNDWTNNSPEILAHMIVKIAEWQRKVRTYIQRNGRAERFVDLDVANSPSITTMTRLLWVARSELHRYSDFGQRLYRSSTMPAVAQYGTLARQTGIRIDVVNGRSHPGSSVRRVDQTLRSFGHAE